VVKLDPDSVQFPFNESAANRERSHRAPTHDPTVAPDDDSSSHATTPAKPKVPRVKQKPKPPAARSASSNILRRDTGKTTDEFAEAVAEFEDGESTRASVLSDEIAATLRVQEELEVDLEVLPSKRDSAEAPSVDPRGEDERVVDPPAADPAPLAVEPQRVEAEEATETIFTTTRSRRGLLLAGGVAAGALAIVFLLALRGGDGAEPESANTPSEIDRLVLLADERIVEGRLVGPGGDTALDHLLSAKKLAPNHEGTKKRLAQLADTFEKLADGAIEAGEDAEAAAHLQSALNADPEREHAVRKLREIEERFRADKVPSP
jgi:hypothetical protein